MLALTLIKFTCNYRAALLSVPLVLLYGALLCLTGMVMFAYFANEECDPLAAGMITNGNQVLHYSPRNNTASQKYSIYYDEVWEHHC